jgi:serine/threonine protein kinase
VALKVAGPGAEARLRAEAALLAELDHPGVVRAHGLLEGEAPALVLDLVPGGDLAERLARRGRLTPTEVVDLGVTLARTLDDLHRAGVVHRDVKPSNVLLTAEGRPVLCDLGTAGDPGVAGTEGYLDPAVLAGAPADAAADVHALGVTLHELLAGELPRPGVPLAQAAPGTPPALVAVVERARAERPADRPPSAAALADELAVAILATAPQRPTRSFGPRPPRPEPVAAPAAGRGRRLVPVAAAALVAALLAGPLSPFHGGSGVAQASAPEVHLSTGPAADWDGSVLTDPAGNRYTLGVTGGEVVLGDWDCDGTTTPGHYDPATGVATTFAGWAGDGRPLTGARRHLAPGRHAAVATGHGCDRLVIR